MPRFVILQHDYPQQLHWDLMLEREGVLATWALRLPPQPEHVIEATGLPDHRIAYLDYEGAISGGRGTVGRWDEGTYELLDQTDARWDLTLSGGKIEGRVVLEKTTEAANRWRFTFTPG